MGHGAGCVRGGQFSLDLPQPAGTRSTTDVGLQPVAVGVCIDRGRGVTVRRPSHPRALLEPGLAEKKGAGDDGGSCDGHLRRGGHFHATEATGHNIGAGGAIRDGPGNRGRQRRGSPGPGRGPERRDSGGEASGLPRCREQVAGVRAGRRPTGPPRRRRPPCGKYRVASPMAPDMVRRCTCHKVVSQPRDRRGRRRVSGPW